MQKIIKKFVENLLNRSVGLDILAMDSGLFLFPRPKRIVSFTNSYKCVKIKIVTP